MNPARLSAFLARFDALPLGPFTATSGDRRYIGAKSAMAGGRAQKLVAEEAGGSDYISFNLYRTNTGARLRPCEMPEAKVVDFVLGLRLDAQAG